MDKKVRDIVKTVAEEVRHWVEKKDAALKWPTRDMNGWCAIASGQLARRLAMEGVQAMLHLQQSDFGCHVYCVVDDYVVDVTATQFGKAFKKVVIMHHREAEAYEHWQSCDMFADADELRAHQKRTKWPTSQTAFAKLEK